MKILITSSRIRSVLADSRTEKDITDSLRSHGIKYHYSTEGGYTHISVPVRSGSILIYRTVSRSAPIVIKFAPSFRPRLWPAYY